jgi:hypothetical protein
MPQFETLNGKNVMIQVRNARPILATIKNTEEMGVWIAGAADLTESAGVLKPHIQNPMFFVPWTSVDWIAVSQ